MRAMLVIKLPPALQLHGARGSALLLRCPPPPPPLPLPLLARVCPHWGSTVVWRCHLRRRTSPVRRVVRQRRRPRLAHVLNSAAVSAVHAALTAATMSDG